jgi:CheY-like chemotaxis protein
VGLIDAQSNAAATVLDPEVLDPDVTADLMALLAEVESSWRVGASNPERRRAVGDVGPELAPGHLDQPSGEVRRAHADILVVDDDEDVRTSMAAVLRSVGYTVIEAVDGQSALDTLVSSDVAVILLDLHMTPRDGIWLLEHIEATPVVVVVSAFALYDEGAVRAQFSHRVAEFLRKPVASPRLLASIGEAFGSQSGP